ncbi:hypothetical protein [Vibrio sp. WXL210]|uniref:hypothetical protein n=1 Tax=Vibrio sp. WXL210 TaxID=3450709 RepID=UPI003EC7B8FC
MKKAVVLPLVAAIAGTLVGCGGSSSSGNNSTPKNQFTFVLAKPAEIDHTTNTSCTRYGIYSIGDEMLALTYSSVGSNLDGLVYAFYSDKYGKQIGDHVVAKSGSLTINFDDIPANGFVTIQENNNRDINAISYSRVALEGEVGLRNTYISTTIPTTGTSCLTGNNDTEREERNKQYKNADDLGNEPAMPNYYFQSQLDEVTATNPSISSTNPLLQVTGEQTVVTQYRDAERTQLFQYGFGDWRDSQLVYAGERSDITYDQSFLEFENISLAAIYKGFSYDLASISTQQAEYFHPSESNGETWTFSVASNTVNLHNNWNAIYRNFINTNNWLVNVDETNVFDTTGVYDNKPSVVDGEIDLSDSIDLSKTTGYMRVTYEQGASTGAGINYAVNHTIYDQITPTIKVPELDFSNVPQGIHGELVVSNNSHFHQSYLAVSSSDDVTLEEFMAHFSYQQFEPVVTIDSDRLGIVRPLTERRNLENNLAQTESLLLQRKN